MIIFYQNNCKQILGTLCRKHTYSEGSTLLANNSYIKLFDIEAAVEDYVKYLEETISEISLKVPSLDAIQDKK